MTSPRFSAVICTWPPSTAAAASVPLLKETVLNFAPLNCSRRNELVGGAARKSDGHVDRLRLRFRRGDQVLDGAIRGIVGHRERVQVQPDHAQRLKLVEAD